MSKSQIALPVCYELVFFAAVPLPLGASTEISESQIALPNFYVFSRNLPVFDQAFCSQLSVCSYLSICLLNGRPQLFIRMLDVHLQLTIHLQLSIRMLDVYLQLTIHLHLSFRMLDVPLQLTIHLQLSIRMLDVRLIEGRTPFICK